MKYISETNNKKVEIDLFILVGLLSKQRGEGTASSGHPLGIHKAEKTNWRRLPNTVDLLIKVACVVKGADLNQLVQGGQLYWDFPFSKGSLVGAVGMDTS